MEDYKKIKALNYSTLSALVSNPKLAYNIYHKEASDKQSEAFLMGSMIDCLLTTPDLFDKQYVRYDYSISPGFKSIAEKVIELTITDFGTSIEQLVLKARKEVGYDSRKKDETILMDWYKEGNKYYEFLVENTDKTVVTIADYNLAKSIASDCLNNNITREYFNKEGVDIEFQLPIKWTMAGDSWMENRGGIPDLVVTSIDCKSLLDVVHFDHVNKTIKPIDVKTYDSTNGSFVSNFFKFKYYYQAAFYSYGLKVIYKDYTILPFEFIALDKSRNLPPLVYRLDTNITNYIFEGEKNDYRYININNRKIKSLGRLVEEASWHLRTNQWDYPKEYYLNKYLNIEL